MNKRITTTVINITAMICPAILLLTGRYRYACDWNNHVWLIAYFGAYFRTHGSMPVVLNTSQLGGMPYPIFYGYWFYQALGLGSAVFNPEVVLRGAVVGLYLTQFLITRKTLRRLGTSSTFASSVACLACWGIYPLTNLYNRSAITEFFAVGLLTCAVFLWVNSLVARTRQGVLFYTLVAGLFATMAAGSHPITALCSLPLVPILLAGLIFRLEGPNRLYRSGIVLFCVFLAVLVLLPFGYACLRLGKELYVTQPNTICCISDLDNCYTRLFPFPLDPRVLKTANRNDVSTPYLDAQINMPLIAAAAVVVGQIFILLPPAKRLPLCLYLLPPGGYTLVNLLLSVGIGHAFLPSGFCIVQFAYRLVTYVDLGTALILVSAALYYRLNAKGQTCIAMPPAVAACILTLAFAAMVTKFEHAWAIQTIPPKQGNSLWTDSPYSNAASALPQSFYGYFGYATPGALPPHIKTPLDVPAEFAFNELPEDSSWFRISLETAKGGFALTNIQIFRWNEIRLDGEIVRLGDLQLWLPEELKTRNPGIGPLNIAIPVSPGSHTLEYRFVPELKWIKMRILAEVSLSLWCGLVSVAMCCRYRPAFFARQVVQH